jgi:hypothetical protein
VSRYFTPDEANAMLPELRPLVEAMVARRKSLNRAVERHAELQTVVGGNGGGLPPSELAEAAASVDAERRALERCIQRITVLGLQVKDLDAGLVDFPALRGSEDVLLCWRLGEDEVAFWHGLEEGFAGRKPLPFED